MDRTNEIVLAKLEAARTAMAGFENTVRAFQGLAAQKRAEILLLETILKEASAIPPADAPALVATPTVIPVASENAVESKPDAAAWEGLPPTKAILSYLKHHGGSSAAVELLDALDGKVQSASKKQRHILRTVLHQLKERGAIVNGNGIITMKAE
jgi:hypothetical protein